MRIEYQINIEYADGEQSKHLSYSFDSVEQRNVVYRTICAELENDQVDMNYLRHNGGVTVSTYNHSDPYKGEIAQIVPHASFKIEVLDKILSMVKK